ncbi:MAG: hypothetical protein KC468_31125, partial [Myxococcales bacterium]|nr:hypothetical protein [Myxococcales bacterium]
EQRARAAEDAGFALAAAWLRSCAPPRGALHESLSPRLSARSRRALAGSHWVREVRARDLMEHPRRYHGWRVRARGVLSLDVERSRFADAWLRGDHGLGPGIWLVEVTGTWSSDPARRYGHLGMYKSELAGVVRALATSSPRRVDPERLRFARPYVPLSAELIVRRHLQGWTIDGAFVSRMAGCPRLDEPAWPDECAMELCLARDAFGDLGVLDWRIVGAPTPLTPRALAPGDVGRMGELVELTGLLRSGDRGGWPVLGDALKVVPPPISRAADRHALPQPELHARLAAQLGAGVEARAIGELGRRGEVLYAIELHGPRGPITSAR